MNPADRAGCHGGRIDSAAHCCGRGAASRFAIGIVVVTGMLVGTLFTLFVLPTIYAWSRRITARLLTRPASGN
jgi:hypothetical protein